MTPHPFFQAEIKNYVLIGEAGSGKTENALNYACALTRLRQERVCLMDMDQTKPLFRARNFFESIDNEKVTFIGCEEFMDSPIALPGAGGALQSPRNLCVLDVGGNIMGARTLGQFREYLQPGNTAILYIVNAFRPFSDGAQRIRRVMENLLESASLSSLGVRVVSNPCMGEETTLNDIHEGHETVRRFTEAAGLELCALTVRENLYEEAKSMFSDTPVIPLKKYIQYD